MLQGKMQISYKIKCRKDFFSNEAEKIKIFQGQAIKKTEMNKKE